MGVIDTTDSRVKLAMENWLAWQGTAKSDRLSLRTGGEFVSVDYIDEIEAKRMERIMLRLKLLNIEAYHAVLCWYQSSAITYIEAAKRLKVGESTFRMRKEKGEWFISGALF